MKGLEALAFLRELDSKDRDLKWLIQFFEKYSEMFKNKEHIFFVRQLEQMRRILAEKEELIANALEKFEVKD